MNFIDSIVPKVVDQLDRQSRTAQYVDDPVLWAKEYLGITLWSKQRGVAESVRDNKSTAVKAGHGVGKSLLAAVLVAWWIDVHPLGDAYFFTTAPSNAQVSAVIGRELRKIIALSRRRFEEGLVDHVLPGRVVAPNTWKTEDGLELGTGRKPPDHTTEDAVQGIHGKRILAIGDEACHDDQTDVLTRAGWKSWVDVTLDDELLTWDTTCDEYVYLRPERLVAYHYEGVMHHYKSKTADFMVTPNHDMLYESAYTGVLHKAQSQDITYSNKFLPRRLDYWVGESPVEFVVPAFQGKRKFYPERVFDARDWAAFLGWFGSEGSVQEYVTNIWQVKSEYRVEIRDLLVRMGVEFSEYDDHFAVHCGQIAEFVAREGRTCATKRVPDYARGWGRDLIDVFLDAYVKGDGYVKSSSRRIIYTSCEGMADDLQELALKAGYNSTVTEREPGLSSPLVDGRRIMGTRTGYVVSVSDTASMIRARKNSVSEVEYSGMVYCATMPENNTLFTRRNGKTLWSGNCGLRESMVDALSNITSNDASRRLLIGNPTNPSSHFGKIFKEDTGAWSLHTISVLDSPNFTDEKYDMPADALEQLTGVQYVEDKKLEYGEGSARYKARILGEFAFDLGDTLMTEVEIGRGLDHVAALYTSSRPVLGVDVARYGSDSSVVYAFRDGQLRYVDSWGKASTVETAQRVHRLAMETAASEVRIDGMGVGGGVVDQLLMLCDDLYTVVEMVSSAASPDKKQWFNARAFWWDRFRHKLMLDGIDLDPDDDRLIEELMMVEYKFAPTGSLLIESKDDMRKRGFSSPDFADAAIYAATDLDEMFSDNPFKPGDLVSSPILDDYGWDMVLPW